MPTCSICSAPHAACGPSTVGTVVPLDERVSLRKEDGVMADLKRYTVKIPRRNGPPAETTLLLSAEDAKLQGLSDADLAGKAAPANKAGKPGANKAPRARSRAKAKPAASTTPASAPADEQPGSTSTAE